MPIHESLASAFVAHYQSLLAFAKRRAATAESAADILHDAFLRIATLSAPERVLQPQAFFVRMVENLAIDRFREQRTADKVVLREPAVDETEHAHASDSSRPDLHAQAVQTARRIDAVVAALPPRCRQVFLLRKVDGLSHDDIAACLNISRNMVEKHLRRALLACQSGLDADETPSSAATFATLPASRRTASAPSHDDALSHDA